MERQEIKPLLYYVQFFNNPRDSDAFNQVINVPRRGVGQQTLTRLHELASARGVDMLEATRIAVTQRAIELNKGCQSSLASFVKLAGIVQELMNNDVSHQSARKPIRRFSFFISPSRNRRLRF